MSINFFLPVCMVFLATTQAFTQELPETVQKQALSFFPGLDKNGDGKLTQEEYEAGKAVIPAKFREKIDKVLQSGNVPGAALASAPASSKQNANVQKLITTLGVKVDHDVVYKKTKQNINLLDVVHPSNKIYDKAPLLIFFHGGGYVKGGRLNFFSHDRIIEECLKNGIAVATVGYRLAQRPIEPINMKDIMEDGKDALRFLAKHADQFNIDPDKFMTWGLSAGSTTALFAALTPYDFLPADVTGEDTKHKVIGAINYYGGTTFRDQRVYGEAEGGLVQLLFTQDGDLSAEDMVQLLSPDVYLTKESPPTLHLYGTTDHLVPLEVGRYIKEYGNKVGADVTHVEIENVGHNFRPPRNPAGPPSMSKEEIENLVLEHLFNWVKSSKQST